MFQSTLQFSSIFGGTLKNIKIKLGMTGPNVIFVKRTLMVRAVVEQHTSGIISKAAKKRQVEVEVEVQVQVLVEVKRLAT
ncbi:hypothetical protein ACOSQ4_022248 [Xanthoceras sorbifolium]